MHGWRAAYAAVTPPHARTLPHAQALFNLANLQRQCGEHERACANYERVLELAPEHWRALLNYSVALAGLGRDDDAKRALRTAFRLSGVPVHAALPASGGFGGPAHLSGPLWHSRAGRSSKVVEEVAQLRCLARRLEDRARLGRLLDAVSAGD